MTMDFDKEAREICDFVGGDPTYTAPKEEIDFVSQALRRAFIAGQPVWRPIQEHVFPWEPSSLIVACFYVGPESELKPEVQIFEAYCSKGNYFAQSAGRQAGMTTLLEDGWTPFAWLDHASPPSVPTDDEMRAAKEHFRGYLGGEPTPQAEG